MQKKVNVRKIAMTAILSAVATVLMFISFSLPIIPSFIKLDFSELPALIAAFSMGPVSGVVVCFIKNLVNLAMSTTGGAGELCNFLMGVTFVVPAGLLYKFRKDRWGALWGSLLGAVIMAAMSFPINLYISYPAYTVALYQEPGKPGYVHHRRRRGAVQLLDGRHLCGACRAALQVPQGPLGRLVGLPSGGGDNGRHELPH